MEILELVLFIEISGEVFRFLFKQERLELSIKKSINEQSNSYYTLGLQMTYDKAGDLALKRTQILPV
ncbi:hypothetical protein M1B35_31910, partial [Pseudomonas sp. MAFF 302046]